MRGVRLAPLDRAILAIALPAMLTNVATALVGLADIWVIGQMGVAAPQAGVEIGSKLFLFIVTIFNFLSFGTTALTAQAAGRGDAGAQAAVLARSTMVAGGLGLLVLAIIGIGLPLGIAALGGTGAVADYARNYAEIRAFAVPAALLGMVLQACLIGRKRLQTVLWIEIAFNLLHVGLAITLVLGLGLGVRGAGLASLVAELAKLALAAAMVRREPPGRQFRAALRHAATWSEASLLALFRLNRDLFLRTLLLLLAIMLVTRAGAAQGPAMLAANAILFQLFMLAGMIMNGFESSAQVLGGEAAGRGDGGAFAALTRRALGWMFGTAIVLGAILLAGGGGLARQFTRAPAVLANLAEYHWWLAVLPPVCVPSFVYDGLFIGATWTRAMLVSMIAAFALYALSLWLLLPLGNHGLWLAFTSLFVFRGLGQALLLPGLFRARFGPASPTGFAPANS